MTAETFAIGDTVYFPRATIAETTRRPYRVITTEPLQVVYDDPGGYTMGPFEISPQKATELGMTHQPPLPEGYQRQVHRSCGDPGCNDLDHLEVRDS